MADCQSLELETPSGLRRVCIVAAPPKPALRGQAAVRAWSEASAWLPGVTSEQPHAVLLCSRPARSDSPTRLDPTLDDDELQALANNVVQAQLEAWQPLLRSGVLIGRVELRVRELHVLRCATERLVAELQSNGAERDAVAVRDQIFYFGASLDTVLEQLLPLRLAPRRPPRGRSTLRELARTGA